MVSLRIRLRSARVYDGPHSTASALESELFRQFVHEHEAALSQGLGIFGQAEDQGLVIETLAFVIDLNLEALPISRDANHGHPGQLGFVAVHDRVHEKLSHDEEKAVGVPDTLALGKLSDALHDRRNAPGFGDDSEV
jgi:hypothetical protein